MERKRKKERNAEREREDIFRAKKCRTQSQREIERNKEEKKDLRQKLR